MEISEISYPINRNTTNAYSYYSSFAYPPFLPTQSKPISLQLYRSRCNHRTKTKPRKKKSSFVSITSNRLVENKRFERSVRKPLGRCITPYHLLRQWTNLKIPLFKVIGHARAGTRSLCTRCTLDRLLALPSIGQYFREGQGTYLAASVYFDKTVRPWTITTKEARSFDDVSRIGLIFVAE